MVLADRLSKLHQTALELRTGEAPSCLVGFGKHHNQHTVTRSSSSAGGARTKSCLDLPVVWVSLGWMINGLFELEWLVGRRIRKSEWRISLES